MADRPEWLLDKPVDVDVDSLAAFASLIQAELDQNVKPGVSGILDRLTAAPGVAAERTFGVDSRYQQGVIIGNYHIECEIRCRKLLEDFQIGMAAIAAAAQSIAADYRDVDDLNQMDVNKIDGYLHPKDRSPSSAERLGYEPVAENPAAYDGYYYPLSGSV